MIMQRKHLVGDQQLSLKPQALTALLQLNEVPRLASAHGKLLLLSKTFSYLA